MKPLRMLGFATVILCAALASAQSPWTPVNNVPNIRAGAVALLTDGRVLVHDESGNPGTWGNWWTLTPSSTGDYSKGTWTQVATMPSNYGPLYFASAVLPDGRYIVEGGEYNFGNPAWTKLGAIYDPVANCVEFCHSSLWVELDRRCGCHRFGQRNLHAGLLLRQPSENRFAERIHLVVDLYRVGQVRRV